jgi:hypothetical protein
MANPHQFRNPDYAEYFFPVNANAVFGRQKQTPYSFYFLGLFRRFRRSKIKRYFIPVRGI